MRLMASYALLLVTLLVNVECQRQVQQGSGTPLDINLRLGLVSSSIGVPPVPGGQTGNQAIRQGPSGCFCLPINQVCPPQAITRIANMERRCSDRGQKFCCLSGTNSGTFVPNPVPITPVRPNPIQINGCGVSNPIPYRQANIDEAQFAEYPWMAAIFDSGVRYIGGGALISSEWILTVAHKVNTAESLSVRLGEHNMRNTLENPNFPHLEVQVLRVVLHPGFISKDLENDVALLQLTKQVDLQKYPHIGTVCLPEQGQFFYSQTCWFSGWGKRTLEEVNSFQSILKEVDLSIVDPFTCQARLRTTHLGPDFILDQTSFLCAGGIEGKDSCTGDGGSPLVCHTSNGWTVVGLAAWGIGCGLSQIPGVYINVPNYINFIRQHVSL